MCIIASSAIGVNLPTNETIETMWFKNPDGAGFMFNKDGKVIIRKGFMTLPDFMTAIEELKKEIDVVNTSVIMHFRIGTHGGNTPENTHPFPVVGVESMLKKLTAQCSIGMAHNGIINSVKPRSCISDTMEYDLEILSNLKKLVPDFHKQPVCQKLIEETINGSRMCFLTPDGEITYIGDWVKDNETGIIYSNSGFKLYKDYDYERSWRGYRSNWASKTTDDYDDEDDFDYMDHMTSIVASPLNEGYIIFENGEMIEAESDIFYIDELNNVYRFDFNMELLVLVKNAVAYTPEGTFARMDENEWEMLDAMDEDDFDYFFGNE